MTNDYSIKSLKNGLIVSCQAPVDSPLHEPRIMAAMAQAAVNNGAVGVRIDTPSHISAVRRRVKVPIIGLWKQVIPGYDIYITPQFYHAAEVAQAGADIIAIDATTRHRPDGETVGDIVTRIHQELGKPVMADVDTIEAARAATSAGADILGTTLYGYTAKTNNDSPPGWELLTQIVAELDIPVICEGGISSPQMARQALNLGAYAVVVGTAITGIDVQVKNYQQALKNSG
ncbi:N-acetylmannosamine-6-phosphate 2-epimerase [Nostoc sp. FACHB-152]|uniref:N-acetylmannosamine-6-phosphate 2-epimerase n=1 Tax=unclassified Nostoc TaxID=2593658 RepID=UPI001683865E|nr:MULTISPECIES: N-acetylmannosamine-6-phosphate 2-epimerase [unclassified Nostoc]MBD2447540.1 N-acetylmannosamine-6-phosphate 2-epimerase [Nostoc sp. FACHB-152]MBD2469310.1 N-acetylmannosamine-6-phosphate 2-epimerase [Nostoc sp. FACHB-145]